MEQGRALSPVVQPREAAVQGGAVEDPEQHPAEPGVQGLRCRSPSAFPPAGSPRTLAGHDTAHQRQLTDTEMNRVRRTHLSGKAQQSRLRITARPQKFKTESA